MSEIVTPSSEMLTGVVKLKDFITSVARSVDGHVSRSHISSVIDEMAETYRTRDFAKRASFFAEELVFEDPRGMSRANTRDELENFFKETVGSGLSLDFRIAGKVIVHDEALAWADFTLSAEGAESASFTLYLLYRFNPDGLIRECITYFDEDSFTD